MYFLYHVHARLLSPNTGTIRTKDDSSNYWLRSRKGFCCFSLWIEWSGIRLVPAYRFILEVLETWNSKLRILTDFLGTHTNYLNAGSISVARTSIHTLLLTMEDS